MVHVRVLPSSSCWQVLLETLLPATLLRAAPPIIAETSDVDELSEEEMRQIKTAERFLSILERNPRRGTALDRVYGHHVEFGSLDTFLESLRERAEESTDDGAVWMLLGLFESQRGNDGAAADAFLKAEQLRPEDAMASYYMGQSQLRIGQSEEAVASFERGIDSPTAAGRLAGHLSNAWPRSPASPTYRGSLDGVATTRSVVSR